MEGHPNEELTFVVSSPVILYVWESLTYPCQQSCGKLFNTNELDAHYRIQCSESHNTIVSSTSPSSKPTQSEQHQARLLNHVNSTIQILHTCLNNSS